MIVRAPAKINLTLEVLGRRPDGFHDIVSVMQRITLFDDLAVDPAPDLRLRCSRSDLEGPENLVWRAARLLQAATGGTRGAAVFLEKHIPVAAGLGGGSSDAAAALGALNLLWDLSLPRRQLRALAQRLGSDVPFFLLRRGSALVEGRGERLTPLPPLPLRWLVLVKPHVGCSAAAVYSSFPSDRYSSGRLTQEWLEPVSSAGRLPAPFNALQPVALEIEPRATLARDALLAAGAPHATMTGSGSTFYALFESRAAARAVCNRLLAAGHETYFARFFDALPAQPRLEELTADG